MKKNKGITLIALVITIIVLLILAGVTIATLTGENGILTQATKAKELTEKAKKEEEEKINMLTGEITGEDESGANHPVLKDGMKAITYNEDGSINELTEEEAKGKKWYAYKITEDGDMTDGGTTNGGNSKWANAILDENYYVWIPRYAYKIYNDEENKYTSQSGNSYKIDVKFIDKNTTSVDGYIVHPAFTFDNEQLEGIWVGKYETSNDGSGKVRIIPNVTSWREINVATMFEKAQALGSGKTNIDAHMMKNIEWGAVAYLTQSQYGRNGTEVSLNQCSDYITGAGRGIGDNAIYNSTYSVEGDSNLPLAEQQYNGKIGKLSSTTGNIYGIYDMAGGAYENVMGFFGTKEDTPTLGNSGFSDSNIPERKYYDLYVNKTSADESNIGDALYETKGWNSDYSDFVYSDFPVFKHGGVYDNTSEGGIFYFGIDGGHAYSGRGFRVCLAVK